MLDEDPLNTFHAILCIFVNAHRLLRFIILNETYAFSEWILKRGISGPKKLGCDFIDAF